MSTPLANEGTGPALKSGANKPPHVAPHLVSYSVARDEITSSPVDRQTEQRVTPTSDRILDSLRRLLQYTQTLWVRAGQAIPADAQGRSSVPTNLRLALRDLLAASQDPIKRVVDVCGALAIGLVASPVVLVVVLAMWYEGGPIIYRHKRVGRGGRLFECLKFRTMVPNADQILREVLARDPELMREWLRDRKLRRDPRITPVGSFLRRTSLDELPQLWNVLRGEMSLVGPRPVVREEMLRYGRKAREYQAVLPGLTGLWQVMGRNNTNYRRRVALDTYYVRNRCLSLDVYILLKTTLVVIGGIGAY